jgi:hypothetical protein
MDALTKPLLEPKVERALTRFTEDLQAMVRKPAEKRDALEKQLAGLVERQMTHERKTFDPMKSLKTDEAKAEYKALEEELKKFDQPQAEAADGSLRGDRCRNKGACGGDQDAQRRAADRAGLPLDHRHEPAEDQSHEDLHRSPHRAGELDHASGQPALDTRDREPRVAVSLRPRHRGTSSDFGKLGEAPTHPELLDFLTNEVREANGWHLKPLHREIMLSAAYRQTARQEPTNEIASKVDPSNRYLWRFNPRRLDAEQVRDALLAVSGELDPKSVGLPAMANGTRRSVYTMKKRNKPERTAERARCMPAGFASTAERQSTTTPTQALQLLNGDWLLARSRKLAERVQDIDDAWLAVLGRPPSKSERETAEAFLKKRAGTSTAPTPEKSEEGENGTGFKENSPHERLVVQSGEKEGDEFTVEAIASLNSIDVNASVRTIASRWNGGKDSIESFGWSLGVTGEKSRYKPRNVIVQVVGEDENANIGYQVVPSNIHIELGRRYHIVARVSCVGHNITFTVRDLDTPGAAVQSAVVPMDIRSKLSLGSSQLVIGGLNKRAPTHQWDGRSRRACRQRPAARQGAQRRS